MIRGVGLSYLLVCLTVSQPSTSTAHFASLQGNLITLYHQYLQNTSAVDLQRFIDARLMRRIHSIIDLIIGWLQHESDQAIYESQAMNYIRSVVLSICLAYADAHYNLYRRFIDTDALVVSQAMRIFEIRLTFQWPPPPTDEIIRFELMRFYEFGVRARAVTDAPYIRLYSMETSTARYFYEVLPSDSGLSPVLILSHFRPIPLSPLHNLLVELEMLQRAQTAMLLWYDERKNDIRLSANLFFFNNEVRCVVEKLTENFAREHSLTGGRQQTLNKIVLLLVLQRYMEFVLGDYDRHKCHPAHAKYARSFHANLTTALNADHIRLERAYEAITASLDEMTSANEVFAAFRAFVADWPLRIGYVPYVGDVQLRIALGC